MNFKDKIAVVTGGSSGIGESTVNVLEKFGAQVINLDIVKTQWPSDNAQDGNSEDYMLSKTHINNA